MAAARKSVCASRRQRRGERTCPQRARKFPCLFRLDDINYRLPAMNDDWLHSAIISVPKRCLTDVLSGILQNKRSLGSETFLRLNCKWSMNFLRKLLASSGLRPPCVVALTGFPSSYCISHLKLLDGCFLMWNTTRR